MGSMKQKRRKQALKQWTEFQGQHDLSDDDVKLARQTGFTLERLQNLLFTGGIDEALSVPQRIREIHRVWQENIVSRKAAIDAGLIDPKKKFPNKEPKHDPQWAKAKQVCRLNMDDSEFIDTYLKPNPNDPPYNTRQMPCPFLGEDNRCTIYDVRPTVCREYPHTNKKDLVFRTRGVAANSLVCPAVYWIVEQMKQQAGQ